MERDSVKMHTGTKRPAVQLHEGLPVPIRVSRILHSRTAMRHIAQQMHMQPKILHGHHLNGSEHTLCILQMTGRMKSLCRGII